MEFNIADFEYPKIRICFTHSIFKSKELYQNINKNENKINLSHDYNDFITISYNETHFIQLL